MSVEAAKIHYRDQYIAQFEQKVSFLRHAATKEAIRSGNSVTFLVSGSGSDTAVSRGVNGQIPYGSPTNTQTNAVLVEKHAPYELTGFNIFSSQGDQLAIMRNASMAVINRDIDLHILSVLSGTTINTATSTATLSMVMSAKAELGNNDVPVEEMDNMFAVISPAFEAYLEQTTEYASGDYVDMKVHNGATRRTFRWSGVNWIVSSRISGIGTSAELCYMWHRSALGFAVNVGEDKIAIGYDEKQDTSWSRASIYRVASLLQASGVVQMVHDGSAYNLS